MLAKARRDKQTRWEWGWRRVRANSYPVMGGFFVVTKINVLGLIAATIYEYTKNIELHTLHKLCFI